MNCYKCGVRQAEIKVVSNFGGKPSIAYYCRKCYNDIKLNNGDRSGDRCLVCKRTFEETESDWNVGCLSCYETLDRQKLDSLLFKVQNHNFHVGKRPEEAVMPQGKVRLALEERYKKAEDRGDLAEAEMLKEQIKGLSDKELENYL